MKIGYLLQLGEEIRYPPFNGPANHVRQVIQELGNLGHQVRTLFRIEGDLWITDNLKDFDKVKVRWIDQGTLRLLEGGVRRIQSELHLPYIAFFESLRFALACRQVLVNYDLFFERLTWMGYGGALASRLDKIPLVVEYNGDPLADLAAKDIAPQGFQRRLSVALMKANLREASHLVATGEGWRSSLIEQWGVTPERISTIENGTTLLEILIRDQLRSFRKLDDEDKVVRLVYLGGFYPWHGVQILLRAFYRAIKSGVHAKLVLIGSGSGLEEAKQLAKEQDISDRVSFTGQLTPDEYALYLADADIGVSPYCGWQEFSGLKLFDYKAAGLATIASGLDGQPQTLRHGQTALIVPPCNEDALTDAIIKLSTEFELRRELGQAARIEAESCHGWEHTAKGLEQVFQSTLVNRSNIE